MGKEAVEPYARRDHVRRVQGTEGIIIQKLALSEHVFIPRFAPRKSHGDLAEYVGGLQTGPAGPYRPWDNNRVARVNLRS